MSITDYLFNTTLVPVFESCLSAVVNDPYAFWYSAVFMNYGGRFEGFLQRFPH